MKTRRRRSTSSKPAAHFAYGDMRDRGSLPDGRRIRWWQAAVFILVLIGLIALTILVLSNQPTETEIKKAFDAGTY